MIKFNFELYTSSSRRYGLIHIGFVVAGKELKNFIAALKKLQAEPSESIVFSQDGFPKVITLRRISKPRKKREWSTVEETANGYKIMLFDDELEMLTEFYVDWLNHRLPESPAIEIGVKFRGEAIDLYFTHDAPSDRTQTKPR